MLLAIDIGNTNIVLGAFKGDELKAHWRVSTDRNRTADEYGVLLKELFSSVDVIIEVHGAVICSVVPQLNRTLKEALRKYLGIKASVAGEEAPFGIPVLTDNPREVGADRVVNAVAAFCLKKKPLIVVDFGTAVTFDYVTGKGEYAGGVIAPGISMSSEALHKGTAKLPRVDVARPERVIGKNTVESIQSGIFYGFVGLVDGIIERMKKEAGGDPEVVATGGLAPLVAGESRFINDHDEFLTLKGLKIIYEGKRNA